MDGDRTAGVTALNELAEARRRIAELEAAQREGSLAEETLRRERNLLNRVMETSPAGITVVDREGQITFANARAEQVLGLTRDKVTQRAYNAPEWHITDYEGDPFPDEALPFRRVITRGQPVYDVRHAIEWPDGRRVLLSINAAPLFDEAGQVDGMVAMVEDVTERVQAEKELRESEDKYRTLVEQSLQGIVIGQGIPPRVVFANPAVTEIVGYTIDELMHFSSAELWALLYPEDRVVLSPQYQDRLEGKPVSPRFEVRGIRKDGTICWMEMHVRRIEHRGAPALQATFVDITERKQVEQELQAQRDFAMQVMNAMGQGLTVVGEEGHFEFVNPAYANMIGYLPEELIGKTPYDVTLSEDHAILDQARAQRLEGGTSSYETRLKRSDGGTVPVLVTGAPRWREGKVAGAISVITDLTGRKQAEDALRESEERFRALVETSSDWIWEVNEHGVYTYASPKLQDLLGYEPLEIVGRTPLDLMPPEEAGRVQARWAEIGQARRPFAGLENANRHKDGRVVVLETSGVPVFDPNGVFRGYRGIDRDITERKQAEDALREHTAELQARNEELDAFAHTVAHDLKAPLGLVIGFAEALEDGFAAMSDEDMRRYLQAVARNGRKMENIIDELLLLAEVRRTEVEIALLDMAGIVAEAQRRLAFLIEAYQAEVVLPAHWPIALGYGPWIEEVWVNYISNALTHGGRPPRVELGAMAQPDGMVRFSVCDNGPGIAPEDRSRLFVPFTQLAQVRATGHGLGLSIVRRIVEKLDGQVGVEGESGAGSTFWFALPASR